MLSDVVQTRRRLDSLVGSEPSFDEIAMPWAVILSQDCDLEQDYRVRFPSGQPESDKLLGSILLAHVYTAEEMLHRVANSSKNQWKSLKVKDNKNERFHFLQRVEPGFDRLQEGLPELAIDFKRSFAIPTDELYRRIELSETKRRCRLESPYLEHLSSRFAYYLSRVALPSDHVSE